jgi:hypothetical protein
LRRLVAKSVDQLISATTQLLRGQRLVHDWKSYCALTPRSGIFLM